VIKGIIQLKDITIENAIAFGQKGYNVVYKNNKIYLEVGK